MTQEPTPPSKRLQVQALLQAASGLPEAQVHFQPPNGMQMTFPAITYARGATDTDHADNIPYRSAERYTVTVIHPDPDNDIRIKVAALPYCASDRSYPADGLNHDVFTLFF